MDLRGAEIRNIFNLCGEMHNSSQQRPMRVMIPYYQRPYRWEEKHIKNLINDFYKEEQNEYFVGSIVMVNESEDTHEVIDGQQRITTMFLLAYVDFLVVRAYIEELLSMRKSTTIDSQLQELKRLVEILFGDEMGKDIEKLRTKIVEKLDEEDEKKYAHALKIYQEGMFLPEKNFNKENEYFKKYEKKQKEFLGKAELSLKYKRKTYNKKLIEALSMSYVVVNNTENPQFLTNKVEDSLINQYLEAMRIEFYTICEMLSQKEVGIKTPLNYANKIIDEISLLLNNIKICVIITGNESDAYTLFEVLNDRALEIEDLDLIKNLFYKWYCHYSGEKESKQDAIIEEVDDLWVNSIFGPDSGVEIPKLISYLATMYFTHDVSIQYNDNARYRKSLEDNYLKYKTKNKKKYKNSDLKNDINVYYLIVKLFEKFGIKYQSRYANYLALEKQNSHSITAKCLHLSYALGREGVLCALVNVIIKKYVNEHTEEGLVDVSDCEQFFEDLKNDSSHSLEEFKEIHLLAFLLWKCSLFSKDYETPREIAIDIIESNNVEKYNPNYELKAKHRKKIIKEFEVYCNNWSYSGNTRDFKVKVLLLNLFKTEKNGNSLVYKPAIYSFDKDTKLELDHMEAQKPDEANLTEYFFPNNEKDFRDKYTNSLGNIMILDKEDNNDKNNKPIEFALKYYEAMVKDHWMIKEVREMLETKNDKYSTTVIVEVKNSKGKKTNSKLHVPNENFFIERRSKLINYFLALFERELFDDDIEI